MRRKSLDPELDMADRRNLDHAVLELLGINSKREREEWIERLYAYLREFFDDTRRKEERAIATKMSPSARVDWSVLAVAAP